MIPAVKRALGEVDPTATAEVRTIRDVTRLEFSIRRMGTWLLGAIGGVGLALALVGLYGVMSYTVHRRTAKIGVRMALGATRRSILNPHAGGHLRDAVAQPIHMGRAAASEIAVPRWSWARDSRQAISPHDGDTGRSDDHAAAAVIIGRASSRPARSVILM